jgi:hypothetical protein
MAHLNGAISDAGALLRKAFELAVPATGAIEFTFIDWTFRTANPNPLPINNPLSRLQQRLSLASRNRNVPLNPDPSTIDDHLFRAGFTERIHRTHMLPLSTWSRDLCLWKIGEKMEVLLAYHPDPGFKCYLEDLCLELLTKWLGMRPEEVNELIAECVEYLWRQENKIFVNLHTWTARRP